MPVLPDDVSPQRPNYVGIDLGTTNSVICSYDGEKLTLYKSVEQHDVTPSAIFVDKRGNKSFGARARSNAARSPANAALNFKRLMGTSTPVRLDAVLLNLTPEECSSDILRLLYSYLPAPIRDDAATGCVITVPAAFNQMQKDATLGAASAAGIGRIALMQEPVAAVMSVIRTRKDDGVFMVYDLGGGTLDVAIAETTAGRVSLLAHGGIAMCGGRDFDRTMFDAIVKPWLLEQFHLPDDLAVNPQYRSLVRMATWAAENAKVALSLQQQAVISLPETDLGMEDLDGKELYVDIPISRATLDELIAPQLDESIAAARDTIAKAGLRPQNVDRIVFVGGPTLYPTLREQVAGALGVTGSTDVNPMTAVAEGAAVRLLPTYGVAVRADDDLLLGQWLAGGATISTKSFERLQQTLTWLSAGQLEEIVETAGLAVPMEEALTAGGPSNSRSGIATTPGTALARTLPTQPFELAGRPDLAAFLNEHIVDILQNRDRYKALGISFPAAVVLHGPPGCGKTFAVEQLIDFLGWPDFAIDAASVASPFIHETSRKVAALFDDAVKNSPSVLVIDEMEAFLADREAGAGHHRIEEVAEFLRRIPEAAKNEVLIIAMTNRIDLIDPAILRRGRFDHIIKVDYASEADIASLLTALLAPLPKDPDVDPAPLARALKERPLSDVAFVVREGARRAARGGRDRLNQADLLAALADAPTRNPDAAKHNRIGFV